MSFLIDGKLLIRYNLSYFFSDINNMITIVLTRPLVIFENDDIRNISIPTNETTADNCLLIYSH